MIEAATIDGAHGEPLFVDEFVGIVEDYLVAHRLLFRKNEPFQVALTDLLDLFDEAGWRKPIKLVYQLNETIRG